MPFIKIAAGGVFLFKKMSFLKTRGIFLPEKRPEIFRALLYNRNGRAYLNGFEKRHAGRAGHADAPMGLRRLENRAYVHPNAAVRQPHEVRHGGIIQIGNMMHCLFRNAEMAHGRAVGSLTHANGKIHGYLIPTINWPLWRPRLITTRVLPGVAFFMISGFIHSSCTSV